jgi:DNA mismatch repair protein MSH3
MAAAEAHLRGLLPQLAQAAGVGRLQYVSIQNQGDWLVELPAERTAVPQGWEKVCSTKKVARYHAPEVKAGITRLAVARETHAAACRAAWTSFLEGVWKGQARTVSRLPIASLHVNVLVHPGRLAPLDGHS